MATQVSQSGYANLINGHASLQSPTGKWRNNELLKTCRFVLYGLLQKILFGGHGKARRTVKELCRGYFRSNFGQNSAETETKYLWRS